MSMYVSILCTEGIPIIHFYIRPMPGFFSAESSMLMFLCLLVQGPYDESNSENKCFLSVMPFKNQSK